MNIAIVVVGFNRPESIKRCLQYLQNAKYDFSNIDLLISIDGYRNNSEKQRVLESIEVANEFHWQFGNKFVRAQSENMGLKKHVLKCGSYVNEYDALIMLEDDIVVSEGFFHYTKEALNYYNNDKNIAGISLYSHQKNFTTGERFSPINDGSDIFFLQIASSWGQVWTKKQWNNFEKWLNDNKIIDLSNANIPNNIAKWPESSWLKLFIKYMVDKKLFFVYPRCSQSTNFTDSGTHNKKTSTLYQVDIMYGDAKKNYTFQSFKKSVSKYDVFFESLYLKGFISEKYKLDFEKVHINFYGNKKITNGYELSCNHGEPLIDSYALSFKPYELNILNSLSGNDLYLYEVTGEQKNTLNIKRERYLEYPFIAKLTIKKIIRKVYNV